MEFQKEELNEILNIFQQESLEIIASMDDKLLVLEKEGKNSELAMQLFRDAHSLKGSARMLGFEKIQDIAHKIEDIISLVKEDKLSITPEIADTISQTLEFISMLINKTVETKEEYAPDEISSYIEKLVDIANNYEKFASVDEIDLSNAPTDTKEFLSKFDKIEEIIINALFIVSSAREKKDYDYVLKVENEINGLISLINNIESEKIYSIKNNANNVINALDKYRMSDNKEFSFLEVNNCVIALIESISNYVDEMHIERKDYYEIVDEKLKNALNVKEEPQPLLVTTAREIQSADFDKIDEIIQKLALLELNFEFNDETIEIINNLILKEQNEQIKQIYINIKEIIKFFKEKSQAISHDVSAGIKEILEGIKTSSKTKIQEAFNKSEIIRTMVIFQNKEKNSIKETNKELNRELTKEASQKEILNSIQNTEIKTLRVDSIKLDNLVGQIGELIVSKIKTNEQLFLAKKINNDLIEWQKNFSKMDYYIKYFDKKYLQNPIGAEGDNFKKIIAYNRQLTTLTEQHGEKIAYLIKEMSNLFKQLQESENKLNTTTNEIETMVKNMRVLPLSTIFQLFPRMVHNIARDKGKKIDLIIEGNDITADKTILEEIKIPLIHIIRNSIDHGIETVEARKALGKNPVGKIEINASYNDNRIIIDVKDDGRGIDIEKIKAKALEKKILTEEEINAISNEELTNLIFYPGFSTEDFVTELSGRGLGLDIVNNKINQLNGRIDIFSEINKGTVVRIVLPATVATKKVFIIKEQKQLYAIETSVIKTIARINADEVFEKDNGYYYIYNGSAINIYMLSQIMNLETLTKEKNKYTLMIIEADNFTFGIIVEKLISDQEIVHKKLAPPLYKVKYISGITTLANGEACLILNIGDIISSINTKGIKAKVATKTISSQIKDNFKYKILVVDDSHTTRILQKNILTNQGYNVLTASNPLDALDKTAHNRFDLIISDVQMPEMTGFEFIEKLRSTPAYEKTPIIVVSSEPREHYTDVIAKTKIMAYIQKNLFKQDELIKMIQEVLNY